MKIIRPMEVTPTALLSSNVPETDYTAWSSASTYSAGARVISTTTHKIYESAVGSNLNHNPATDDGTWWLEVGATNRWSMFDTSVQSQTKQTNSIVVGIQVSRADSIALLNVDAGTARVKLTDPVEGVVYDKTIALISDSGVQDWWSYFFEPVVRRHDAILTDLPPLGGATLELTISDPGEVAGIGGCVIGLSKFIGETALGPGIGIRDYSVKETDEFGNFRIVQRAYSKRASFTVLVDNAYVDELQRLLSEFRATPIVYLGDEDYASTLVYGFYRDFNIEIAYPDYALTTLELEGLT